MADPLHIAVDLGAGSGRVFLGGVGDGEFLLEEIYRFHYPPVELDGHLRWEILKIFENIKFGLSKAVERASQLDRPAVSIGVDGWGVDYGLLDEDGGLIAEPVCYRDSRTEDAFERAFSVIGRSEIYARTGIQFLSFNTLYQLISESADLEQVNKLLLLPDLINFFLTGRVATEYTNATTTQMVNAETRNWDNEIIERFGIPGKILSEVVPAGTSLGPLRDEIADSIGSTDIEVILPATHDTGSAIAAAPIDPQWAYISSGTWSLIGIERTRPLINAEVAALNFTNEGGVFGTTRFLKNVMGLWILESCRREWDAAGIATDHDSLIAEAEANRGIGPLFFPDDQRLLNPSCMLDALRQQLSETGQEMPKKPAEVAKMILDSLAFRYASVLRTIMAVSSVDLTGVQILGGGGRNRYLNQMTADASGIKVRSGLYEATVVGNILVQAIALGIFPSLQDARDHVSRNFDFVEFEPTGSNDLTEAMERYSAIEARYSAMP